MAKKIETPIKKIEREYVIPLREKCRPVPRYKKTPKAVKSIKEFLVRHMKIYDWDLKKIKIDKYLNEFLWFRGIKKPPIKVKVKAIKQGDIVIVELAEMPDKLKFKKIREEKRETKAKEILKKKKIVEKKELEEKKVEEKIETKEKPEGQKDEPSTSSKQSDDSSTKEEKKKKDEKEKKSAVVEAGQKRQKQQAKKQKHTLGGKSKQPKRPIRVVMNK